MVRHAWNYVVLFLVTPVVFVAAQEEEKPATDKPAVEKPADDQPADEEKPASESPTTDKSQEETTQPEDAVTAWKKLSTRKLEIAQKLAELRQKFGTATVEEKRQIRDQYQELIDEFLLEISPEMVKLADEILNADPENREAAEFVIQQAWNSNDYPKAVELIDRLSNAGTESEVLLNYGGLAYFAENQFEKALELLSKAKANNQLDPQTGGRYLDQAQEYVELWKAEQAIREQEANAPEAEQLPRVELTTSNGKIVLELFENEAPNTVANFIALAEDGFFDGTKFHRVIENFMIQGGDPNSKDDDPSNDGIGGPGYSIDCECFKEGARMHFAGSLSMAHSGRNTGGSQFFITHLPTWHLNPENGTQSDHTVFGRVIEGLDVVRAMKQNDSIEKATVIRKRDHEYQPKTSLDQESEPEKSEDKNS